MESRILKPLLLKRIKDKSLRKPLLVGVLCGNPLPGCIPARQKAPIVQLISCKHRSAWAHVHAAVTAPGTVPSLLNVCR